MHIQEFTVCIQGLVQCMVTAVIPLHYSKQLYYKYIYWGCLSVVNVPRLQSRAKLPPPLLLLQAIRHGAAHPGDCFGTPGSQTINCLNGKRACLARQAKAKEQQLYYKFIFYIRYYILYNKK